MLIFLLYFDVEKMLPASEVCQSLMLSNKVKSIDDFKVFSKFHRL